jgi:hypothetical protein
MSPVRELRNSAERNRQLDWAMCEIAQRVLQGSGVSVGRNQMSTYLAPLWQPFTASARHRRRGWDSILATSMLNGGGWLSRNVNSVQRKSGGAKRRWRNERVAQNRERSGPPRSKRAGRSHSRKDKEEVMAPAGMIRPYGKCYGRHMHLSPPLRACRGGGITGEKSS